MKKSKNSQTVIFIHIPKASGTSLLAVLRRQYSLGSIYRIDNEAPEESVRKFKELSQKEKHKVDLVEGHWPFGLHAFVSKPYTYITLLRNPIERVISHYYHVLRTPDHYAYRVGFSNRMNLEDYVFSGIVKGETHNGQTWFLSGGGCDYVDNANRKALEFAKRNIDDHFAVVGLTEMFNESVVFLRHALGWNRVPFYYSRHVGNNRHRLKSISPRILEAIRNANQLDLELYQHVSKRFTHQIAGKGPTFRFFLKCFTSLNSLYKCMIVTRFAASSVKSRLTIFSKDT